MVKEQFREADVARKVNGVSFMAGSSEEMRQVAQIPVVSELRYTDALGQFKVSSYGPLDSRLGTCQKNRKCGTCGKSMQDCVGHFGYIDLELPVFHVGYFRLIIQILQSICKSCSHVLLPEAKKKELLVQVQRPTLSYLHRKNLHQKILTLCKKNTLCPECKFKNGVVKKAAGSVLKIAHNRPGDEVQLSNYLEAIEKNLELESLLKKQKQEALLNPEMVLEIFSNIPKEELPLLMIRSSQTLDPSKFILTRIPVPPVCIRPSVISEVKSGTTEDDLTMKLCDIGISH